MDLPSAGQVVAGLAVAFVAVFIYVGVRMRRESREQDAARKDAVAAVQRRATAKGRRFAGGSGRVQWTVHGAGWTLEHAIASRETDAVNVRTGSRLELDTTFGQSLVWCCASLRQERLAFKLYARSGDKPVPDEVALGESPAWWRWRVEASDPAAARRAFSPAAAALIERLPLRRYANANIDQRTWMQLGEDGLMIELGIDELTPDLADLVIEIGETLANGLSKPA